MVQAFLAVVYELWCFVTGTEVISSASRNQAILPPAEVPATLAGETVTATQTHAASYEVASTPPATYTPLHEPTIMYVSVPRTNMHRVPRADFDTVIMPLEYGAAVTAVSYEGNYVKVFKAEVEGWIVKDHILSAKETVWPQLHSGVAYAADHEETRKLRLCIGDAFSTVTIGLPLQAVEYITLRLALDNRSISWPLMRPREAGSWQWLLRGGRGIHISVHPVTDSIIEWLGEDGFGRLGYVEAVHPDRSLMVSLVGLQTAGVYEMVTWSESVWRELRPVFIEVV